MKGKALIIWILVLAAAAGAWFLSGLWQEREEKSQAQAERPFSLKDPLAVQSLQLSGREVPKPIRVERQGPDRRWVLAQPLAWPADEGQVGRLISSLLEAKVKERTQALGRLADFGLQPPAYEVVMSDGEGNKSQALFGDLSPGQDFLYAAAPGSSQVWFLPADLRGQLGKSLLELRDKRLMDLTAAQVEGFRIRLGDKHLECARWRTDTQPGWEVKGLGPADPREVDKLIYQLRGATVTGFLDQGINPERMGLVKPWGEIRLSLEQGAETGLLVGGLVPGQKAGQEERYARRLEGGPAMTVKQETLDRLAVAPKEVLERRLLKLERGQVLGLTIARGGETHGYQKKDGGFVRTSPPGDERAGDEAEMLLFDLLNLRWDERLPAGKPLDQAGAVITVSLAAGEGQAAKQTLILGPLQGQGPLEARVEGDPQGYLLPRDFAARLPQAHDAGQ